MLEQSARLFCLLAVSLMTGMIAAGCGDDSPTGPSATELEGSWSGTDQMSGSSVVMVFSGNTATVSLGGTELYRATFTLNTTTTPKQINAAITSSSIAEYVGKTSLGVYELDGNSLTFAANEPGVPTRPSSTGSGRVFNLTRQ